MKRNFLLWTIVFFSWALPGASHALNCYQNQNGGPVAVTNTLPNDIYVSSAMPAGTVLWRSDQISYKIYCTGRAQGLASEKIIAWINPAKTSPISGVSVGIIYNGVMTTANQVDTGYSTINYEATFVMTYSIVLVKTSTSPVSGSATLNNYRVFQLDGVGGTNASTAANVNQYLNGKVTYSAGGTCSLAAGDANRTIFLSKVKPADLAPVGKVAGKTQFALTVSNCTAGTNSAQFSFEGTPDSNNSAAFANTGTAKGVAVGLGSNDDGTTIRADGTNNMRIARVQGGSAVLNLYAQYVSTGAIQAGTVSSKITMNITYQ